MTPERAPRPTRDEVLLDFATHENGNTPAVLAEFVSRYPGYAHDLAQLAVEIERLNAEPCVDLSADDIAAEDAALAAALADVDSARAATAPADPFAGLSPQAFRSVAKNLGVKTSFLGRFKERLIEVATIPQTFLEALAKELSCTAEGLRRALDQAPRFAASVEFKSDVTPSTVDKQSFEEAMEEEEFDDEQKRRLRG